NQPYFINFSLYKKLIQELDSSSQKSYVCQIIVHGTFTSSLDSVSLNVNTDIIPVGINGGKTSGIFTFPARQFQDNRLVILKVFLIPVSFNGGIEGLSLLDYIVC